LSSLSFFLDAILSFSLAIDIFSDSGRFGLAAKYQQEVAKLHEVGSSLTASISAYESASKLYSINSSIAHANECDLKIAELSILNDDFKKSIEYFEKVAFQLKDLNTTNDPSTQYRISTYLLSASICRFVLQDHNATKKALQRYLNDFRSFQRSHEYTFLAALIQSVSDLHLDGFIESISIYDSVRRLTPWMVTILLDLKNKIPWIE